MYLFAFYVPHSALRNVEAALFQAGAGRWGHYDHGSWKVIGESQFRPLEGAIPAAGQMHKVHRCEEVKVEMIVARESLDRVIETYLKAHPYQEPAFHVIKLSPQSNRNYARRIEQDSFKEEWTGKVFLRAENLDFGFIFPKDQALSKPLPDQTHNLFSQLDDLLEKADMTRSNLQSIEIWSICDSVEAVEEAIEVYCRGIPAIIDIIPTQRLAKSYALIALRGKAFRDRSEDEARRQV